MPSMSKLRLAAVLALATGAAVSWANTEQDSLNALASEDACAADDEACVLSFRQLRGEQVASALGPKDADEDADEDAEDEDEDADAAPKKKSSATAKKAKKVAAKKADEDEDDGDDEDENDDEGGDEDDWYGDEDDEEEKRGIFCCQFGQGKGAKDLSDVGASCYPSSKPEVYDFCDNKDICTSDCNGTWIVGFCALNGTGTSEEICGLELNEAENGYDYTGAENRAVMEAPCAASADACSGCNGTWCEYVKTPIY